MKYDYNKENLQKLAIESTSYRQILQKMNIVPKGGNYKTLKMKMSLFEINTTHFSGPAWNKGVRYRNFGRVFKLEDILIQNSKHTNNSSLRQRLIKCNIKDHKCEECQLIEWLGKPISLELHHKNGINNDNRIENLQLLCPNCHSFTDNYRGRNKKPSVGTDIQV